MKKQKKKKSYDPAQLLALLARGEFTQVGAAKALGIADRTMRRYCAGKREVPTSVLLALKHLISKQRGNEAQS